MAAAEPGTYRRTAAVPARRHRPRGGRLAVPHRLGYWPAALCCCFRLARAGRTRQHDPAVLCAVLRLYLAVHLLAALFGSRWFSRGDGFEVYSTAAGPPLLPGPARRRAAGAAQPARRGGRHPRRARAVRGGLGAARLDRVRLAGQLDLVGQPGPERAAAGDADQDPGPGRDGGPGRPLFLNASLLAGRRSDLPSARLVEEFAHTLVPIVAGYVLAHYWSLLVLVGQQTISQLSDPFATGADLLGTAHLVVEPDAWPARTSSTAAGHRDRARTRRRRGPRPRPRPAAAAAPPAVIGQIPLLVLMVGYTVAGLILLFSQ